MNAKHTHTPGPWDADIGLHGLCIGSGDNPPIAAMLAGGLNPEADAERIVACVNACEGMIEPAVEISGLRSRSNAVPAMCAEVEALRAENERLREALQELDANCENRQDEPFVKYVRQTARAALAGGKQ